MNVHQKLIDRWAKIYLALKETKGVEAAKEWASRGIIKDEHVLAVRRAIRVLEAQKSPNQRA